MAEQIAIFGDVDRVDACSPNVHAVFLKLARDVERSLAAKLDDDAKGLFLFVNLQNVFCRDRLKVQFVGSVVVGGNGFGVAVYDDCFVAHFLKLHGRVAAAVVELDSLSDSVGAAAQNHDFLFVVARHALVGRVVCRIVVVGVLDSANGNGKPSFGNAKFLAAGANVLFRDLKNF